MKYVNLGTTGIKVSELCLGTMTFGKEADRRTSEAIYRRCREAGINFFDCANVYSSGEAERILGEIIPEERDRLIGEVRRRVEEMLKAAASPSGA